MRSISYKVTRSKCSFFLISESSSLRVSSALRNNDYSKDLMFHTLWIFEYGVQDNCICNNENEYLLLMIARLPGSHGCSQGNS